MDGIQTSPSPGTTNKGYASIYFLFIASQGQMVSTTFLTIASPLVMFSSEAA